MPLRFCYPRRSQVAPLGTVWGNFVTFDLLSVIYPRNWFLQNYLVRHYSHNRSSLPMRFNELSIDALFVYPTPFLSHQHVCRIYAYP
jgi:hypothetical protein